MNTRLRSRPEADTPDHDLAVERERPLSADAAEPERATPSRSRRVRKPIPPADRPAAPLLQTVLEAAETLRTSAEALRARLRRAQVRGPDGTITAPLGPGIVGLKVGANTWRVRFDAK